MTEYLSLVFGYRVQDCRYPMCYGLSVDIPDKDDRKKYPYSGENAIEIGMKRSNQSAGKKKLYKMNQVLDYYSRQSDT
jgi:hypothetical protein